MSPEPSKKSPRSFQCRESLWQKFELMAQELECSVDYLINDAMKQYARQRGYGVAISSTDASLAPPASAAGVAPPPAPPQPSRAGSGSVSQGSRSGSAPLRVQQQPTPARPPAPVAAPAPVPAHAAVAPAVPAAPPPAPPPAPATAQRVAQPRPAPPVAAPARLPPIPTMRSVPPPNRSATAPAAPRAFPLVAAGASAAAAPAGPAGSLAIYYKGEFFKINKDRFIIGRGKQSSDLTIKDPNVSRQHAMIEYLNGQYYIVDMGSTNGIEFEGQRIQRKSVSDGDIFRVCDHELLFVYQ